MKEETSLFLQVPDEINALLAELGVTWADLLQQEGLEVRQEYQTDPAARPGSREKEPVTILLASAGLVMALAPAIARVITSLSRRPVKVTETILVPVEDSKGNVIKDSTGAPVLNWVERTRLLEPGSATSGKSSASLEGPLGLKLKLDESN